MAKLGQASKYQYFDELMLPPREFRTERGEASLVAPAAGKAGGAHRGSQSDRRFGSFTLLLERAA